MPFAGVSERGLCTRLRGALEGGREGESGMALRDMERWVEGRVGGSSFGLRRAEESLALLVLSISA